MIFIVSASCGRFQFKLYSFSSGKNFSVQEFQTRYDWLRLKQKWPGFVSASDKYEAQRLKAEHAREKAELMTEKAEAARMKRINLENELLEIQIEREKILLQTAKTQKKS